MSVPDVLPPSPPNTSSRRSLLMRPSTILSKTILDDSPASLISSSGGSRKRVEFSPWTNIHNARAITQSNDTAGAIKSLPPSRDCSTSVKSILKPFTGADVTDLGVDGQQDTHMSFSASMESIAQQLANGDRATKVDAYYTMVSLLKAYDEVPEALALKNKMQTITKYIRRDITVSENAEVDPAESNLINQALKALVVLVWSQHFSPLLSDEYRSFILDRSIQVLAEHRAPKSNVVHYVHLLSTQDFRATMISSNNRSSRLLDALSSLTEHYKGNGIVSERLMVYHRLLDQARPVMQSKAHCWLHELLTALVSPISEIRERAIVLGMKACAAFPSSASVSSALRDIFRTDADDGRDLSTHMCRRLEKMVIAKEWGTHVPRTWGIVILLMGGVRGRIENWNPLKDWLKVIQRCFNCSDSATRHHANLAWNRFVSIVRPHEGSESLVSMLAKPISAQLERNAADKQSKSSRATAVGSYCNLLYYAFRPAASHKQYTRVWNEYVVKVMTGSFFDKNSANADLACRVLIALFWNANTTTKVWREHRAHEPNPVDPEELPTIDCRWIKARAGAILHIFKVLFRYSSWGSGSAPERAFIAIAWQRFANAVGDASCREIKPSAETRQAILDILSFLSDMEQENQPMDRAPANQEDNTAKVEVLCKTVITQIGNVPLAEVIETDKAMASFTLSKELIRSACETVDNAQRSLGVREQMNSRAQFEKLLGLLNVDLTNAFQSQAGMPSAFFSQPIDLAVICLRQPQPDLLTLCLKTLQPSLALWLEDADGKMASTDINTRFISSILSALNSPQSNDIESLDLMLSAAFRSTHKDVINQMIGVWNTNFGHHSQLAYPPLLQLAVDNLRPFVDLDLPGIDSTSQGDTVPPRSLIQSQNGHLQTQSLAGSEVAEAVAEPSTPPASPQAEASRTKKGQIAGKSSSTLHNSRFSTPRSRISHDDSQVKFVAIESSPLQLRETDSQYLTERQKEVRGRRREGPDIAAFFSDLSSEAFGADEEKAFSDNLIARRAAASRDPPATPTLPPVGDDEGVAASPTPKAKQRALRLDDLEVPSSPPGSPDVVQESALDEALSSPLRPQTETDGNVVIVFEGLRSIPDSVEQSTRKLIGDGELFEAEEHQVEQGNDGVTDGTMSDDEVAANETAGEAGVPAHLKSRSLVSDHRQAEALDLATQAAHERSQVVGEDYGTDEARIVDDSGLEKVCGATVDCAEDTLVNTASGFGNVTEVVAQSHAVNNEQETSQVTGGDNEYLREPIMHGSNDSDVEVVEDLQDQVFRSGDASRSPTAPIDSDEIDYLSASQLSNDLDLHVEIEGRASITPVPLRKRKTSDDSDDGRKRKKKKTYASKVSPISTQKVDTSVQQREMEEIYDCIIVDLSPAAVAPMPAGYSTEPGRGGDDPLKLQSAKRMRGRPRKSASQTPSQDVQRHNEHLGGAVKVEDGPLSALAAQGHKRMDASEVYSSDCEQRPPSGIFSLPTADEDRSTVIEDPDPRPWPNEAQLQSLSAHEDVSNMLQKVLARLKSARPNEVDLRAVDDLCFDIRTEAQKVVMRDIV